jgi:hypothetical protein
MVHVDHFGEFGGEWTARRPKKSLAAYREFMIGKHSKQSESAAASEMGGFGGFGGFGGVSAALASENGVDESLYQPFAWENGESSAASGETKLAALGASPLGRRGGPSEPLGASWTEYAPESAEDYEREISKEEDARFALAAAVEALAKAEHPRGSEAASTLEMGRETLAREGDDRPSPETLLAQAERVLAVAEASSREASGASRSAASRSAASATGPSTDPSGSSFSAAPSASGDVAAAVSTTEAANGGGAAALDGSVWSLLRPRRDFRAAAVSLGPVWVATFVGVAFGLFLIAIQVSCNLMRKGKRGCGTNEGEVRSLVAVAKGAKDAKSYGGTPAKTV